MDLDDVHLLLNDIEDARRSKSSGYYVDSAALFNAVSEFVEQIDDVKRAVDEAGLYISNLEESVNGLEKENEELKRQLEEMGVASNDAG